MKRGEKVNGDFLSLASLRGKLTLDLAEEEKRARLHPSQAS